MSYSPLRLRKNEERRLRAGHLWIFSNEVDVEHTPLRRFSAGDLVRVEDSRGQEMGVGYVNPESLIAARLLTRNPKVEIGAAFIAGRLQRALALRDRLYHRPYYRLVYGESDGLPGLVVDRYGEVLALQTNTAGMDRLQPLIVDQLQILLKPRAIVLRNESGLRQLEGLDTATGLVAGDLQGLVEIEENGVRFRIDVLEGQKTGWFFDHRDNRARAAELAKGRKVLDLFSYSGAWGVQAAAAGAASVHCVDGSESALALARENARLNGVDDRVDCQHADVFDFLRQAREERRHYDVILLDPPALIKRKKDAKAGLEAYRRLNQGALQLLSHGGVLVSASCSYHLASDTLHDLLRATARQLDRHLVLIGRGGQGPDHPVHPAIPETDYLKAWFCVSGPSL
ncbi:MAG: class I SAM-dependent rRNA methyltransferase [Methylococcaceae bacterium]|nr:class I SAM-dependent rRNA methyltransferase [Methylococcaceae bacterium]